MVLVAALRVAIDFGGVGGMYIIVSAACSCGCDFLGEFSLHSFIGSGVVLGKDGFGVFPVS